MLFPDNLMYEFSLLAPNPGSSVSPLSWYKLPDISVIFSDPEQRKIKSMTAMFTNINDYYGTGIELSMNRPWELVNQNEQGIWLDIRKDSENARTA